MRDTGFAKGGRVADNTRRYTTRSGKEVILHETVPHNSAGQAVTFPIKGSVITLTPKGRRQSRFQIWTPDGRADVLKESPDDLIDFPPLLGLARTACGCDI